MRRPIPLDGLGMDYSAMCELVNRMNANDDREWFLDCGTYFTVHSTTATACSFYRTGVTTTTAEWSET